MPGAPADRGEPHRVLTELGDDDDLRNPDFLGVEQAGTAIDRPTWSGSGLDRRSANASWTVYAPTGSGLLSASARVEHRASFTGEADGTPDLEPQSSYSSSSNTMNRGQERSYTIALPSVTIEAWSYNAFSGMPVTLLSSGQTVQFSAGGTASSRHRLLLFRAPLPTNALTLKTAATLNAQTGTLGFNDECLASTGSALVKQATTLPQGHFVLVDQDFSRDAAEPVEARPFLWVEDGTFPYCDGTAMHDCRYGRVFDDYRGAQFVWPEGRKLRAQGQPALVADAAFSLQAEHAVPAGVTRALGQEP